MSRSVLDKLLYHSFINYQVLFNNYTFHSHNPHHLGSLYYLGASDEQLESAYKEMCKELIPYEESPNEVNDSNWKEYWGHRNYCKTYRDFFYKHLTTNGNNWQEKYKEFLLDNPEQPLINSAISGVAHPLIHIGYGFELDSQLVAAEALTMTATFYDYLHEYVDQLKAPSSPSKSALEVFRDIHSDNQLPLFDTPGDQNLESAIKNYNERILFHYNQWKIDEKNLEKDIEELFDFSVYIYGATHKPDDIQFDFFLLHLLTSMNAVRIIYLHIKNHQICERLFFQYFYFAIAVYITQLRPEINPSLIDDYKIDPEKHNWNYVIDKTLNTKFINEVHLVKIVRALRDAEKIYGNKNDLYLKTAVKTVDHLDTEKFWILDPNDERQLNILRDPKYRM